MSSPPSVLLVEHPPLPFTLLSLFAWFKYLKKKQINTIQRRNSNKSSHYINYCRDWSSSELKGNRGGAYFNTYLKSNLVLLKQLCILFDSSLWKVLQDADKSRKIWWRSTEQLLDSRLAVGGQRVSPPSPPGWARIHLRVMPSAYGSLPLLIRFLSCCCEKIPELSNVKEGRAHFLSRLRVQVHHGGMSRMEDNEISPSATGSRVRWCRCPAHFFCFVQSRTPSTFLMGLPPTSN